MPLKPKIAIIGAGFSGLACAWHLLNSNFPCSVALVSDGKEASKIAAGLLHKYVGLKANINPLASIAEAKSHELLQVSSEALNRPVILSKGILRLALTEQQKQDFFKCASLNDDVEWLNEQQCKNKIPLIPDVPGIFIHSGMTIDTVSYLEGLLLACIQKGLHFEQKHISGFHELESFDIIIAASGPHIPLEKVKLHPLKGQLLELEWPKSLPLLPFALVSQMYLVMSNDNKSCIAGATYEHHFESEKPDPEKAIEELYPKACELYPPLKDAKILSVKAGIRCTLPSRMPFIGHVRDNIYAITGMGSRGLLYHAYFAESLIKQVIHG